MVSTSQGFGKDYMRNVQHLEQGLAYIKPAINASSYYSLYLPHLKQWVSFLFQLKTTDAKNVIKRQREKVHFKL